MFRDLESREAKPGRGGANVAGRSASANARVWLRRLHLWLGLALGLPFAVLALTGSALVFYIELDGVLNPQVAIASSAPAPGWSSPTWDRALETARSTWPKAKGRWTFEATGLPGAIPGRYYAPRGDHHHSDPVLLWFSPDGTRLLREARWGETLMTFLYDIHHTLLAGETGTVVVGWLGVATLLLLTSGVAVWWPRGSWRKALALKRGAPPLRTLRDWHKLIGLGSAIFLLLLSATGALLALPGEKEWLLARLVAPMEPVPAPRSARSSGEQVRVATALAAAQRALPGTRLGWIDVPGPGDGTFRIRAQVPGDPGRRFPYSYVFVDQYSGEVLAVHDARVGTAGSTVSNWIRPLHDASVGGLGTRILGVAVGLMPLTLFITGLLRWRLRRRAAASAPAPERTRP
jgi:uncharacterized iron-regulated membrane protein